jgi:hypothetical protein
MNKLAEDFKNIKKKLAELKGNNNVSIMRETKLAESPFGNSDNYLKRKT